MRRNPIITVVIILFLPVVLFLLMASTEGVISTTVNPVPSTINDFFFPGSQPLESGSFLKASNCNCHDWTSSNPDEVPYFNWKGSMMAQAQRDPLYLACLAISNQDAPEVGDLCIRCHTPVGWLEGRSEPTDGSDLTADDREGVQCHFCHKLVKPTELDVNPFPGDPDYVAGTGNNGNGPSTYDIDQDYLASLSSVIPAHSANGMYIVESDSKNRRGPYSDSDAKHDNPYSPFHPEAEICGTCHDVSNPAFSAVKDIDGNYIEYAPNDFDTPAPDFSPYELFPVERTFSEWKMSDYNTPEGVESEDFGGNKTNVSTCQDCHMKDLSGYGAQNSQIYRTDLPHHDMTGGNTFMPDVIATLFPDEVDVSALNAGKERALYMLKHAASVEVEVDGQNVDVEVINETGHKLPSGYPEGRRIWINLIAYDVETQQYYESGKYNYETAELDKGGTKIYEIKPGIGSNIAEVVNLPEGPSFHFVLNNEIFSDNRIPPRGFTNANFEMIQSPPVNYTYVDGQYWDNTIYNLPFEPDYVEVKLYYQSTSKEYVEFLRDENVTNDAGDVMYEQWTNHSKSAPEVMNHVTWSANPSVTFLKWTGNENSDWGNADNWDENMIPTANTNVIIPSGLPEYPIIDGISGVCNFLTMESGAQLTVQQGADLQVNGPLLHRDGRYGIPSLIEYGNMSVTGFIEAQMQLNEDRWHYFSPPLANLTANSFYGLYLYSYNPNDGTWVNIVEETTPLADGVGYKVWTYDEDAGVKNVLFRGSGADLHSGIYNLPVNYSDVNDNYSFVGNPYLSSVDWDHGSWVKDGVGASVYVWDGVQYLSWNGSIGALTDGVIPAMQGFFVVDDGSNSSPVLSVSNLSRTHGPDPYKKSDGSMTLQLKIAGNGYYDNTYISFDPDATKNFDPQYDAFKIMGREEAPQLYTVVGEEILSINVLPNISSYGSIPINLDVSVETTYTISFQGIKNFPKDYTIFFVDKQDDVFLELTGNEEYIFSASSGDDTDRFEIKFNDNGLNDREDADIVIYSFDGSVYVDNPKATYIPEEVRIYALSGELVFSSNLGTSEKNIIHLDVEVGVYLVKVYTSSKIFTKKVFLK